MRNRGTVATHPYQACGHGLRSFCLPRISCCRDAPFHQNAPNTTAIPGAYCTPVSNHAPAVFPCQNSSPADCFCETMTTQEKNLYQPYLTSGRRFLTCSISDPHRGCWDRTSISPRIVDRLLDQTPATRRECARDNPDWGRALYRESRSRDRMVCIRHR